MDQPTGYSPGYAYGYEGHDPQQNVITTQPPPMSQMQHSTNVVVVQQQPTNTTIIQQTNEWTTGLCGCFEDCADCAAAWFCCWCHRCYLSVKLKESCCLPVCCCCCDLMILRMKIRTMRNIPGGAISDCCATSFCGFCAATQMSREWDNSNMG
ncbi:placenta-specific gene 8 protein-like [Saccoglossus kowalevskii]